MDLSQDRTQDSEAATNGGRNDGIAANADIESTFVAEATSATFLL